MTQKISLLEIELEDCPLSEFESSSMEKYWEGVMDGSLKFNGAELRFKKALNGDDVLLALEELDKWVMNRKTLPYVEGNRGSTHVHINISDMNMVGLYNFVLLSYLCEPLLMSKCTADRNNNSFSMTSSRTKDQMHILREISKGNLNFGSDYYKYRAIGLNSMYSKGSLEFRMFHASYDKEEVLSWINLIQEIKCAASRHKDLTTVIKSALEEGLPTTLKTIFDRDVVLNYKSTVETWDFIRNFAFVPTENLKMQNTISKYYLRVMGEEI